MLLLQYSSGYQDAGVDLSSSASGNTQQLGQRFRLRRAAPIGRVKLYLKKTGSPVGYLQVEIQTTSDNDPSTDSIGSSNAVPMSSLTTSYALVNFDFPIDSRPLLTKNIYYHIILKSGGYTYADGTTEVVWGCDQSSPFYYEGEGEQYDGSDWSDISTDTDFVFTLYSKERSVYSSLPEVEGLTHYLTSSGKYDHDSVPSISSVMDYEESVANEIDAWMLGAGFNAPVTNSQALDIIRKYANFGVAYHAEMTQRTAGFREGHGSGTRAGTFYNAYSELRKGLQDGGEMVDTFTSLGLARTSLGQFGAGLSAGGVEQDDKDDWDDDDDLVKASFQRDMWDNA
jgi:hypothetical protein